GFIYLMIAAVLILALSAPASRSAASTQATLLESIQQQINELMTAVLRIQARIMELLAKAAKPPVVETEQDTIQTSSPTLPPDLYRFSIAAGAKDAEILSVTYTFSYADVSVKDLEVFVFYDELFSDPILLRNTTTKRNRVGRYPGYLGGGSGSIVIPIEHVTAGITIPAHKTYYFELRGSPVGKNKGAFFKISAEGLAEITLE
ncbi:MAG: hypothetical protein G01um101470_476, partial [Parcubacteria group bacterium Gr01-1014_70]